MDLDIRVRVFILHWVDCLLFWTAEVYLLHDVRRWKKLKSDDLGAIETRTSRFFSCYLGIYFLNRVQDMRLQLVIFRNMTVATLK
jgi:hypothetical protein